MFGKGSLTYEGTVLSDTLQTKVLMDVLQRAGITGPDQALPLSVRAKHGANRNGKMIHYYLNYSSTELTFGYLHKAGKDLLTQAAVSPSQKITLKPWDVVVIEEK
jgi:beta-galactosidase